MINLLPKNEKEALAVEEKWKLTMILGILGVIFFVSLALILLAININISADLEEQKILLKTEEERLRQTNTEIIRRNISRLNENLSKLDSFYKNQIYITGVFEEIAKLLSSEIYLKTLSYDKKSLQIMLSGFSPTREALVDFKKDIEKEKSFQQIYFPPSNWVKPKAIDFSVTFKLTR